MVRVGPNEESILRDITDTISNTLNAVGLFNRVFSRIKSNHSIERKLREKEQTYRTEQKKMQDVFGIRITLYFADDEDIAINLIKNKFIEYPEHHSIDPIDEERFGPQRCNLIFKIPDKLALRSSLFQNEFIDTTFEVQF